MSYLFVKNMEQTLTIREQRLGLGHPCTLDTHRLYTNLLQACGRTEEAATLEAASTSKASKSDKEPLRL